jgi:hypothetical protein
MLAFQHYDVKLETGWVFEAIGETVAQPVLDKFTDVMNPSLMRDAYLLASRVADKQVLANDFPIPFTL